MWLDRSGTRGPASATTWDAVLSSLRRYVGFAQKMGGGIAWESEHLLYDGQALMAYAGFLWHVRCGHLRWVQWVE